MFQKYHFISEKYDPAKSFNLHFLQTSPFVQLSTSTNERKGFENIPGSHFVEAFSAPPSHSL
jgi:hypothetical protein